MGRKKLAMRRIENAAARQVTYAKRKDGIVKKAKELSVLCDTDVALIMFSPTGRLTTFSSDGSRIEDIFLRFVDRPDELRGGYVCINLFIFHLIDLEEKLDKLNRRQRESQEKMRYYEPNLEKINSALEAGVYQQFLTSSIQRIQLSKAKLLGNQHVPERTENIEMGCKLQGSTALMDDATSVTDNSIDGSHQNGVNSLTNEGQSGKSQPKGPHLSLSFIEAQRQWNKISNDVKAPNFNDNY
ncbi:AGAMOUS-like 104 [Striga hermonthica]|uniref:AGAMOUS-like 104 n=1 Tax=Striga hermonthica TaxID=68872 RepID=A0A9N7NU79_STRHE|nr:AGAMOUS-like 104 [Striga hermonthica]